MFEMVIGWPVKLKPLNTSLLEKCPYLEVFWSVFSRIPTEYRKMLRVSPYSVWKRENTEQKNSEYRHFSCNASVSLWSTTFYAAVKIILICEAHPSKKFALSPKFVELLVTKIPQLLQKQGKTKQSKLRLCLTMF